MIERICQWIVKKAGLNVAAVNQSVALSLEPKPVSLEPKPDRPDLEALQAEHDAEMVAKDEALSRMQVAIEDLDRRLRRSDPIVALAISQDQNNVTYAMVRDLFNRLTMMSQKMDRDRDAVKGLHENLDEIHSHLGTPRSKEEDK